MEIRLVFCLLVGAVAISATAGGYGPTTVGLATWWCLVENQKANGMSLGVYDESEREVVSVPHSLALYDANLDGFKESGRTVGWYRRQLVVPDEWVEKKLFLEFQGAMQATTLWVNGEKVGEYAVSGYDSFDFDITQQVRAGTNILTVKVDNSPNPNLPPDGGTLDYTLFGGLYRDVFLHVKDPVSICG